MRPQILKPGAVAPPLVRGLGYQVRDFIPRSLDFLKQLGFFLFLFLKVNLGSFGGFYGPINNFAKNPGFVH
jgi:hypothetical protein